jgi:hypothetical protein
MTEGETKAPPPNADEDFRRRDKELEQEIKRDEKTLNPTVPKPDHASDGGVF